jgi:hypothetical protein
MQRSTKNSRRVFSNGNENTEPLVSSIPRTGLSQRKKNILINLNIAAFALHLVSFIAALAVTIVYASQSFQTEITQDFRRYDVNSTSPSVGGSFSTRIESRGYYQLVWVDLPFPIITSLFHAFIAFYFRETYLGWIERNEGNPLRWIEYSITASLMTWVILQLSGVTNVFLLIVCGPVANILLQAQGFLQEKLRGKTWLPTMLGWLIFAIQWTVILSYFFTAISSERPENVQQVPWFVYSIIIGLLFLFAAFGLVQLTHLTKWPAFMKSAYAQDIAYLVLSLTAKLFLTWNLLIGIATNGPSL